MGCKLILFILLIINPCQSINSFSHDFDKVKYINHFSPSQFISYENYFNNQLLSVFNSNKLDELIKGSNLSKSCVSSLRRFIDVIQGNQFEYWASTSELMLINLLINSFSYAISYMSNVMISVCLYICLSVYLSV